MAIIKLEDEMTKAELVATQNSNNGYNASTKVSKAGDTMTGPLQLKKGSYVATAIGRKYATSGYIECVEITTGAYRGTPFNVELVRVGYGRPVVLTTKFKHGNVGDLSLEIFETSLPYSLSSINAWIYKKGTNKWGILISKELGSSQFSVASIYCDAMLHTPKIEIVDNYLSTLPVGAISATLPSALVEIWSGSATAGQTITLSESIYNFRLVYVRLKGQGTTIIVPIMPGNRFFRGEGGYTSDTPTVMSYQINGSIVSNTSVRITQCNSISIPAGVVTPNTVSQLYGMR